MAATLLFFSLNALMLNSSCSSSVSQWPKKSSSKHLDGQVSSFSTSATEETSFKRLLRRPTGTPPSLERFPLQKDSGSDNSPPRLSSGESSAISKSRHSTNSPSSASSTSNGSHYSGPLPTLHELKITPSTGLLQSSSMTPKLRTLTKNYQLFEAFQLLLNTKNQAEADDIDCVFAAWACSILHSSEQKIETMEEIMKIQESRVIPRTKRTYRFMIETYCKRAETSDIMNANRMLAEMRNELFVRDVGKNEDMLVYLSDVVACAEKKWARKEQERMEKERERQEQDAEEINEEDSAQEQVEVKKELQINHNKQGLNESC